MKTLGRVLFLLAALLVFSCVEQGDKLEDTDKDGVNNTEFETEDNTGNTDTENATSKDGSDAQNDKETAEDGAGNTDTENATSEDGLDTQAEIETDEESDTIPQSDIGLDISNEELEYVGNLVIENLLARDYKPHTKDVEYLHYSEIFTSNGAFDFLALNDNQNLAQELEERYSFFLDDPSSPLIREGDFGDYLGAFVVLSMYMQNGDKSYLDAAISMSKKRQETLDRKWVENEVENDESSHLACDNMYTTPAIESAFYRITKNPENIARVVPKMKYYINGLQTPSGLFYHTTDSKFFWLRGLGWAASGLTKTLLMLPENHPDRLYIMNSYKQLMSGILKYQTDSGLWCQLIDYTDQYEETSGTSMLTYAMATGIHKGWLDHSIYVPVVQRAWSGLMNNFDESGNLDKACVVTNGKSTAEEYLARPAVAGDLHAQAALLWLTNALLRLNGKRERIF